MSLVINRSGRSGIGKELMESGILERLPCWCGDHRNASFCPKSGFAVLWRVIETDDGQDDRGSNGRQPMIENMQEYIRNVREMVSQRLDLTRNVSDEQIREAVTEIVAEESGRRYMSLGEKRAVMEGVFNSQRGLDVLQPLVDDPSITEIMINGPDRIFVEKAGRLHQIGISFGSNEKLENVILNIVSKVNRTVNEASPIGGCPADRRLSGQRSTASHCPGGAHSDYSQVPG